MSEADETGEAGELGPIATRIIYEDERVRIWDQRIAPGEHTATHRHEHDYALIDVEGDSLDVELFDGPHLALGESRLELPVIRGQVYWVEKGSVERAVNSGDSAYRGILVEIKD